MSVTVLQQAKATLRKELKQRLAAMTDQERHRQSDVIAERLFQMEEFEKSSQVSLYLHMQEEVSTTTILKRVLAANKQCFIPYYKGSLMKMVKLESWEDYLQLPETKWKIKQPADDDVGLDALDTEKISKSFYQLTKGKYSLHIKYWVTFNKINANNLLAHLSQRLIGGLDLILMPGLGFTRAGDRIGRGKGYYDGYLHECRNQGFSPFTIALAFNEQICDKIPVGDSDQKLDFVLYPDREK